MPFIGGKLEDLLGTETTRLPTRLAMHAIADAGGRAMTEEARRRTPVRTGAVRASLQQRPVTPRRGGGFESGVESHHWRAPFVEAGVKPHDIEPETKKAIETPEGPRAGAHHPGYPGTHMVASAAALVEARFREIAQPSMSKWAEEIEQRAKRHKGIS